VEAVVADLAGRLGISAQEVTVEQVKAVQWPDSSMGCPQPGYMYTQVITPGYQIILKAQGKSYDYRTDESGGFVLCE